jgi:hypothetical protein
MRAVFTRWSKWPVVFALVLVTGGHWALLQSIAWVGMTVNYAKCDSFEVALQKTFDGQHPCRLCKLVKQGKASEQKRDLQKLEIKFDLISVAGACGLFPPRPLRHFQTLSEHGDARARAPLLPPPRAA